MSDRLKEVIRETNELKRQLSDLWETRQKTDAEVLKLSIRIDQLLNEHDRLLRECDD